MAEREALKQEVPLLLNDLMDLEVKRVVVERELDDLLSRLLSERDGGRGAQILAQLREMEGRERHLSDAFVRQRSRLVDLRQALRAQLADMQQRFWTSKEVVGSSGEWQRELGSVRSLYTSTSAGSINAAITGQSASYSRHDSEASEAGYSHDEPGRAQTAQQQQVIVDGQVMAQASIKWELEPAAFDFSHTEKLGAGQYGEVFRCKYLGSEVACKKLYMQNMDEKAHKEFLKEVQILSCLRHPNLILLLGICTQPPKLFLVTECMKRGSVETFLYARRSDKRQEETDEQKHLTYRRRMLIAKGTAQGMNWLHNLKPNAILHLDLKPANLLLDDNYNVKICDFGMSKIKDPTIQDEASSLVGTPYYMCPEILSQERYDQKADVYSFGILLNELHAQQLPYAGRFKRFLELKDAVKKGQRPDVAVDTPPRLKELITRCWNSNPAARPTFKEMLADQVFDRFILDYLISDANRNARVFWERKFFGRYTVSWSEFVAAFCDYFQIRQVEETTVLLEMLKAIIARDGASHYSSESVVTVEQFSFILEWFGPFEHGSELLTRVFSLCSKKWFHGNITSVQAENMLVKQGERGCFLVRFSTSNPGSYTLSSLGADKQVRHRRINHRPGGPFDVGDMSFPSLEALIKNPPRGLDIVVKKYCHGSQFQAILAGYSEILRRSLYVGSSLGKLPKSPSVPAKP